MTIGQYFPESVQPRRPYPFWSDVKLNAWAGAALLTAIESRSLLHQHADWSLWLRFIIALAPLLPSLLYLRSLVRWIASMDEFQRRLQVEACLFATTATVFLVTALGLLGGGGLLESTRLRHGLGWEGTFATIVVFYILGTWISNRRYR